MRTPDAEKEKDKKLIDPDEYDIMQVGDTAYARKKGTKGPFTSSKGDTYEVKKSNDLFDSTLKTQVGANLSSRTTHTVKYEGKITQGREKLKKQIEKGRKWFEDLFE